MAEKTAPVGPNRGAPVMSGTLTTLDAPAESNPLLGV